MSAISQFSIIAERLQRRTKARKVRGDALADHIRIDKDVPIPAARSRGGWAIKGYTAVMRRMQPGDSVHLPIGQAYCAAMGARILGQGCYATRSEGSGTRVWRTR